MAKRTDKSQAGLQDEKANSPASLTSAEAPSGHALVGPPEGATRRFRVRLKHLPDMEVEAINATAAQRAFFKHHGIVKSDHQCLVSEIQDGDRS